MRATILKIARDAYRAIGAEGFARVDFLLRGDDVFLSEINTIPGFTPISLFPTMPADGRLHVRATSASRSSTSRSSATRRGPAAASTPGDLPR